MRGAGAWTAACLLGAASGGATVLDFEGLPFTVITSSSTTTPDPASVLTDQFRALGVVFGEPGRSAGVAVVRDTLLPSSGLNTVGGLDVNGDLPGGSGALLGDIYVHFVEPGTAIPGQASNISFTIGDGGGDLDLFEIRTYDPGGVLLSTQPASGVSRFPVTVSQTGVSLLVVDFLGQLGYSFDDLAFDIGPGCAAPEAEAGPDLEICLGARVLLDGSGSAACPAGTPTFVWRDGPSTICPPSPSPTCPVTPALTTAYELEMWCGTDPLCSSRDTVWVLVDPDLTPPDLGNTLRAVRRPAGLDLSWASSALARGYALYRGTAKGSWPPAAHLSGIAGNATSLADLAWPPALYFYQIAGQSCSGREGPH